jgi:hypothetical protein
MSAIETKVFFMLFIFSSRHSGGYR